MSGGAACRTAGDLLRNFGGPAVGGARGFYERLLKVGTLDLKTVPSKPKY